MASAASIEAVQQAYIAYYGRPADPAGLDFWASRLDDEGGDITSMIQAFGTSTEATELYGSGALTVTRAVTAVNNIYNQVFGRDLDDEGESFYVSRILSGEFTFVDVAQRVLDGATGTDAALIANKTLAAQLFTDALAADDVAAAGYVGTAAAQGAKTWLAQVDETLDSVVAAEANLTETVQANGDYTYTYAEAVALYASDTLPANFSISDESVDLGSLAIGDVQDAVDEATAVLSLASNATDFNSDNVTYALEDSTVDGGELTVAGAVAGLADIASAIAAASNGDEVTITATYSLNDTLANLVAADASVISGASSYSLSSTAFTFDAGAVTVAGQAAAVAALGFTAAEQAIVDGSANAEDVTTLVTYTYADTLANIVAAGTLDASYALTDDADLGGLSTAEIAVVSGATNASDFSYGSVATLTTSTDTIQLTANSDTIDGSTVNTLQAADFIIDNSTTDSDVLNALITTTTAAPRITNIETINLTARFNSGGLDLTNVSNATDINVQTNILNGSFTLTNIESLKVGTINVGSNIETATLSSLSSGTRDYVTINMGGASGSVVGNAGGADFYNVSIGEGGSLTLGAFSANDVVNVSNSDTDSITLSVNSSLETLGVYASGDLAISATYLGSATTIYSGGDVTFDFGGNAASALNGLSLVNGGANSVTVIAGSATTAALHNLAVDYVVFDNATATTALGDIAVNSETTLRFSTDVGTAFTVAVGTANATGQTGVIEFGASQTGSVTTDSSLESVIISSLASVTLSAGVNLNANTNTVVLDGSNNLNFSLLDNNGDEVVDAQSLTGNVRIGGFGATAAVYLGIGDDTVSSNLSLTVYAGDGDDVITGGAGVTTIYGQGGDDVITGGASADSILGGDGDDVIINSNGADTVTLGSGSDIIRSVASGVGTLTVTDFDLGVDLIQLTGNNHSGLNLSSMTLLTASSTYSVGVISMVLSGITTGDLTDSVQLGISGGATYDVSTTNGTASVIVAGDFNDHIKIDGSLVSASDIGQTITLGGGNDVLYVVLDQNGSAGTGTIVTDFNTEEDLIVLTGTMEVASNFNLHSVTPTGATYTLGSADAIKLTGISGTDISTFVQLGRGLNDLLNVSAISVTLGQNDDFIQTGSAGTISFEDAGGIDYLLLTAASAGVTFDFTDLSGITGSGTNVAANSAVADALNGEVYVFANGEDGAGDEAISFTNTASAAITGGSGSFSLSDVAQFLAGTLGETSGEKYVAIINHVSAAEAYAFYVDVVGDTITEDSIELIAIFDKTVALTALDVTN